MTAVYPFTHYRMRRLFCSNRIRFIVCVICLSGLPAAAQESFFTALPEELPISTASITSLLQDKQGFIWIGTWTGLYRYDGYTVKAYSGSRNQSGYGLTGQKITSLREDRSGFLWVGTANSGLFRYDPAKDHFTGFTHDPTNPNSISSDFVWGVLEDDKGRLWVGTANGLNCFYPPTGKFVHYLNDPGKPNSLINNYVYAISQTGNGALWVATQGGLDRIVPAPGTADSIGFDHYPLQPEGMDVRSTLGQLYNFIYCITPSRHNEDVLWVGTKRGLHKVDIAAGKNAVLHYTADAGALSQDYVRAILEPAGSEDGSMWVATDNGLNHFEPGTGTFRQFFASTQQAGALSDNMVLALTEDRSGVLWVGTNKGANKLVQQPKAFQKISFEQFANPNCGNITSLAKGWLPNMLLTGTYGGGIIQIVFQENGQVLNRRFSISRRAGVETPDFIYSLWYDSVADCVWASTRGAGILKIPAAAFSGNGIISNFDHFGKEYPTGNTITDEHVMCMFPSRTGSIYFGAWDGGLIRWDRAGGAMHCYQNIPGSGLRLTETPVVALNEYFSPENEHFLLLGTRGGGLIVLRLDERGNPVALVDRYRHRDKAATISNDFINCVFDDGKGRFWIGTEEGLNFFDFKDKTFKSWFPEDGLPEGIIQSIAKDENGYLWVSTTNGLVKAELRVPGQPEFRGYLDKNAFPSKFFSGNAALQMSNGRLAFGTNKGICSFFPGKIKDNTVEPPVVLTDFRLFNKSVPVGKMADGRVLLSTGLSSLESLNLSYDENVISFEFAGLHFTEPAENRYAYRLLGFSEDWTYIPATQRLVTFTNLPSGEYTFEVKAANSDGIWSTVPARLHLCISPPWWRSWWAYTLYALLAFGLIRWYRRIIVVRENLRQEVHLEHLKNEKLGEVNQIKMRFFTNISHELRTPLTLIISPLEEMMRRRDGDRVLRETFALMHRNASRLAHLVNQILDFRKSEEGLVKLEVVHCNLVKFLKDISLAFKDLALNRNIDFKFLTTTERLDLWFDRDQMEKVFFNLLSNAFKFTDNGGHITVTLDTSEQQAFIRVQDSGIGIAPAELEHIFEPFFRGKLPFEGTKRQGSGIGLALTKSIVELHRGDIAVESKPGEGACFTVKLQLGKAHFKPEELRVDFKDSENPEHYRIGDLDAVVAGSMARAEENGIDPNGQTPDKPLLLIIEDNADIRAYLRLHLQQNYQVEESEDGRSGLEKAQQMLPDLILSDVIMPEMDGMDLCRHIKTDPLTSHIPVVLLTARTAHMYQIEGYETGADDYITKPFNVAVLAARLRNLLDARERLRMKYAEHAAKTVALNPSELAIGTLDEQFLSNCLERIEAHIADEQYSVEQLARDLHISRMQVYRKVKALTGDSPNHLIRTLRLKRAAQLLQKGYSVAEATYLVGFSDLKYFRECFRALFGVNPSEYGTLV